ncbi:MAG TPA: pilus assembly protein TadG-related protein [Acidothermaceae bacterium]
MGFVVYRRKLNSVADDGGAIAIIVALLSVVLFGFAALVVDIGHADDVHLQGQSAVDAASLAGVRVLANGGTSVEVVAAVKDYVKENMGISDDGWKDCEDPAALSPQIDTDVTNDTCISILTSPTPEVTSYQVRVKLPTQHVPATFGGLFGVSSIGISPVAQALSGQPLPPECGPCTPAIDESTDQPQAQPKPAGYPALPDPALVPPATAPDSTDLSGCPPTPGRFSPDNYPDGVTIAANFSCTLKPGLYVFENTNLVVPATASIGSFLSDGLVPGEPPAGTGVTLVFYGTSTLTVGGHIGILVPGGGGQRSPLVASLPSLAPPAGEPLPADTPIPGVAIVFDQFDTSMLPPMRTFTLGDGFDITGSVYALDGQTTWATNSGDCMPALPVTATCAVHDEEGISSVIATTATAFAPDPGVSGLARIPTVATDHPMAEPPPSPPHLVK